MNTDTAGNPIYAVPAYCETCGGPTNTAGQCPKQSCVPIERGLPVVTVKCSRCIELEAKLEQSRLDRDEAISQCVSIGRESKKMEAEVARLLGAILMLREQVEQMSKGRVLDPNLLFKVDVLELIDALRGEGEKP